MTALLYEHIMSLSANILSAQVDRDEWPSETAAKKLSEVETCRLLLGYCELGWNERHHLPSIWADLKKQEPDHHSCEAVLAAFFENLVMKEPSLRHFSNQELFDDTINHRFTPGETYETCQKGFSPLAFLPKTFEDINYEKVEEEYYIRKSLVRQWQTCASTKQGTRRGYRATMRTSCGSRT